MMESSDSNSLRRELSAFADGELDPASTDRLLRELAIAPARVETLRRYKHLSVAASRAVRDHTPPPSESLRHRLEQLAVAHAPTNSSASSGSRTKRVWPVGWAQAAAAIILLGFGVWLGHRLAQPNESARRPNPDAVPAEVLPASVVAQAEEVHGFCSRLAEGLHTAGYPRELAPLASSVEQDLHSSHPYPDLGPIGYRYRGAGPCGVPLGDTVHLLYRSVRAGSVKAISVFVQPWRDQFALDEGRLYTVSMASSPFPILAWRTDRVVYFLLADDATTLQKATALIRGRPASQPSR